MATLSRSTRSVVVVVVVVLSFALLLHTTCFNNSDSSSAGLAWSTPTPPPLITGRVSRTMVRRDSHELSPFPSNSELSELHDPLLSQAGPSRHTAISSPPTSSSSGSRRRSSRRTSTFGVVAKRFWKPLVALSLPPLLLFLYAVVHPHVPGLPPLPKVSVHYGSGAGVGSAGSGVEAVYEEAQVRRCTCGDTDEGRRQCDVYGVEGLERSRLVKGTGARVRRMLLRGREGHKLKIGVLGGSGE